MSIFLQLNNSMIPLIIAVHTENLPFENFESLSQTNWKLLASSTIVRLFGSAVKNSGPYKVYKNNMNHEQIGKFGKVFPQYVWESFDSPKTAFFTTENVIRTRLNETVQCKVKICLQIQFSNSIFFIFYLKLEITMKFFCEILAKK